MKEQRVVPFSLCQNAAIRRRESQNKLSVHFQGIPCPMTWCVLWTTRDKDTLYIFPSYVVFSVDVKLRELSNFLEWLKKRVSKRA